MSDDDDAFRMPALTTSQLREQFRVLGISYRKALQQCEDLAINLRVALAVRDG